MAKTSIIKRFADSSWMTKGGIAVEAYLGYDTYQESRQEGQGVLSSLGQAAIDFALPEVMGFGAYLGYELTKAAGGLAVGAFEGITQYQRQMDAMNRYQAPFMGNTFVSNERLDQMKAASLGLAQEAIQGEFTQRQTSLKYSKMMKRSKQYGSLGNEAAYL